MIEQRRMAVLAMCVGMATAAAPVPDDPTIIGGHTYRFPKAVFQGGAAERGKIATILLEVRWPGMEGLDIFATNLSDALLILGVSNADGQPYSQAELAEAEKQTIQVAVSRYDTPASPLHAASPGSVQGLVPGDGMIMVEAHQDGRHQSDVFVSPSVEAPTEMISCNQADDTLTNPLCQHRRISRGMLLKVTYARPMVVRWKEIDAAVERFFMTHEVIP